MPHRAGQAARRPAQDALLAAALAGLFSNCDATNDFAPLPEANWLLKRVGRGSLTPRLCFPLAETSSQLLFDDLLLLLLPPLNRLNRNAQNPALADQAARAWRRIDPAELQQVAVRCHCAAAHLNLCGAPARCFMFPSCGISAIVFSHVAKLDVNCIRLR